jgi:Fe-S-cluster containining protein
MPHMLLPLKSDTVLKQVDTDIFRLRYFGHCMQCTYCMDSCCQYGCDVNLKERDRILAVADELAPHVRGPKESWFSAEVRVDPDYETGRYVRTQVFDGACPLLRRDGRGCGVHHFAVTTGRDYHELKPMVCWLFPVTWDQGLLRPSYDITDDLACKGSGPIVYDMARDEIGVVFGQALLVELDRIKAELASGSGGHLPAR